MSFKRINLIINKDDIRSVISNVMSKIIERHAASVNEVVQKLNIDPEEQTSLEILEMVRKMLKNHKRSCDELENISSLILALDHDSDDFVLPPDTEVVEDLPDLKEDGLAIGSRSE